MNCRRKLCRWIKSSQNERPDRPVRPLVMGILNVTPDSFSDGGQHLVVSDAVKAAHRMRDEGADLIDVGAESTRPGSDPVSAKVQIERLVPILDALAEEGFEIPLTVDTTLGEVARVAMGLGVAGVNDILGGTGDPDLFSVVAEDGKGEVALMLMHIQGTPKTMQVAPSYSDVVAEVGDFLQKQLEAARQAGIRPAHDDSELLVADPGIGFGKNLEHNVSLLRHLGKLRQAVGVPLLVGTSRKGFLGALTGRTPPSGPIDRLHATNASVAWAVANGAGIVRVHEVGSAVDTVRVVHAIMTGPPYAP